MTVHAPTQANTIVKAGNVEIGNAAKLAIIAGPCQLESRSHAFDMAGALKEACAKAGVGLIYKTSYDKALQVRPGDSEALNSLANVHLELGDAAAAVKAASQAVHRAIAPLPRAPVLRSLTISVGCSWPWTKNRALSPRTSIRILVQAPGTRSTYDS